MDSTAKHGLCEICLWSIQHAKVSTLLRGRHYSLCSADPRQQDGWCIPTVGVSAAEKGLGRVRKCFLLNLQELLCRLQFFFGRHQALGANNMSCLLLNAMHASNLHGLEHRDLLEGHWVGRRVSKQL